MCETFNLKIEITDEEDNGDILTAEMEQMQTFLEFKVSTLLGERFIGFYI